MNDPQSNVTPFPGTEPDVNTPSLDYKAMEQSRELPRALVGGTKAMRKGGAKWTPKLKGEGASDPTGSEDYKRRLEHFFLVDFYNSSVTDMVDRMFSGGIMLDGAPQEIIDLWENIDGQGRSGEKFFYDVTLDAGRYGMSDVHVDHTPSPLDEDGNPRVDLSEAEEAAMERRPFLVHRKAATVIAVDQTEDDGLPEIEAARLRETKTERDGFKQEQHDQVRELKRGMNGEPSTYTIWRKDDSDTWVVHEPEQPVAVPNTASPEIKQAFQEVFLVPLYLGFERFHFALPAFRAAAMMCLEHWQIKGDIRWIEHLANTPSLLHTGDQELKIDVIGSRKVAHIGGEETLEWLVIDPKGIAESKKSLEQVAEDLRMMFRQPTINRSPGKELLGVRQLDEGRPMTRAQLWAHGIAQSITQCLKLMGYWRGIEAGDWQAEFPKDALQQLAQPKDVEMLVKSGVARLISKHATQTGLKAANVLDEEHDIAADLVRLEGEAPELPSFDEGEDEKDEA